MRPILLTMSAFGPYADQNIIDMKLLGEKGIYLITGRTGAGKTTIFDAITFALYGEPSGDNKDASVLRCKSAKDDVKTYVELDFVHMGKTYHLYRNPSYMRPKGRGEGMTMEPADARIVMPDGTVITKTKDVNQAVYEIIGLKREQFTKIAMIAQGDFLKLLLAKTEDRRKIFSEIFHTEKYYFLTERLKSLAFEVKNELNLIYIDMKHQTETIYVSDEMKSEIDTLSAEATAAKADEIILRIEEVIKQDKDEYQALGNQMVSLSDKQTNVDIKKGQLELQAQNVSLLNKALSLKEQIEIRLKDANEEAAKAKSHEGEAKDLKREVQEEEIRLKDYQEYDEKVYEVKQVEEQRVQLEVQLRTEQSKQDQMNEEMRSLVQNLAETETVERDRELLCRKYSEEESRSDALHELIVILNELEDLTEQYQKAQERYQTVKSLYESKDVEYANSFRQHMDAQAGILADTLREDANRECPVCGSRKHPHLAVKPENYITKDYVDGLEAEREKLRQSLIKEGNTTGKLSGSLGTLEANYQGKWKRLLPDLPADSTRERTRVCLMEEVTMSKNQLTDFKQQIVHYDSLLQDRENWKKRQQAIQETKEQIAQMISQHLASIASFEGSMAQMKANIQQMKEKLKYANLHEAKSHVEKLNLTVANLENQIDKTREQLELQQRERDDCCSRINALEESLGANRNSDEDFALQLQKLSEESQALNEERKAVLHQREEKQVHITANKEALHHLKQLKEKVTKAEEEYKIRMSLYNTAAGNVTGKSKIKLETFIQMNYLDRILRYANVRFMVMSSGQYELIRRVEAFGSQSQSGLELDVVDHYAGITRSVNTLSGGEAFIASLSLALGMSDEIQQASGGIAIESLFVDEGFGTLSQDVLEQAVTALYSVTEGNRLVGIISHVDALKERVEKQIVVDKNRSGESVAHVVL